MDNLLIRPALLTEHRVLEDLQRRSALSNDGDREALLANPDAVELPVGQIAAGRVFVAEYGDAVAGFATVLRREDGDAELDGLFVEPGLWRRGVGRLLVERCAAVAREEGAAALHVVGNPHAGEFYMASGFEITGSQETRFGAGLLMQRKL
jgi:GNAT superfamily N-acetyltransferase